MSSLPPVFIEFLGSATGFHATARGVRTELAAVEREGGGNMARLGAVSKAALLGVGIAAAATAVKTVHMAADFQTQMTRVRTGAGELQKNMETVSHGVLTMAGEVGQSTHDLTSGLYMVESAGFHGTNALNVLRVSAKGAKVGAADLATVTDAVTTAMNAYNLQSTDVAKNTQNTTDVMNALIGTEAEGKTNMEALAGSMSTILPVSSAAHIGLNEVLGAMATMTSQGTPAAVAATYLRQTIGQLSNPTAKAASVMKGLGLNSLEVSKNLGTNGLASTLNMLTGAIEKKMGPSGTVLVDTLRKASKNTTEYQKALANLSPDQKTYIGALASMVGGTKSMMGALQLTGPHMATFQANVKGIREHVKAGGKDIEGWADVQKTFNQRMAEAKGSLEAVGISIGTVLLPYATKMVGWLSTGITWLTKHKEATYAVAAAIGGVLVIGLAAAAVAAWNFTAAILANPVTWIVVGVMALVAGLVLLVMHWRQVWTFIQKDIPVVARIFTATWKAATAAFNAVWKWAVNAVHASVKWFDDNVLKWLNKRLKDLTSWWHANSAEIAQVWALMWTVIKNEADLVWGFIKAGLDILKSAWVLAWHLLKNTVNLVWGAISSAVTFAMHLVLNTISLLMDVLTGKWGKAWRDLLKLVTQAFSDIGRFLGGLASDFGTLLWDAGADLIKGLIGGIKSMAGAAVNAAKDVGTSALHGVKSVLGIKSPSRVFRDEVGKWIPHGIAAGITAHAGVAHDAMREVANGTVTSLSGGLSSAVTRMGTAPALAGGGAGGRGPVVHNHVHVEVHGTVRSDRDLRDLFQQEMLRLGGRNSATWQPYRR